MPSTFDFCLPTRSANVPNGPDWLHEVKYDGYRLRLERDGDRVRLITRGGYNWTDRYPWIAEAARKVRQKRFVIDGEAVILGVDGISDFDALHSRRHDDEVQLCAFDILVEGGDDLRKLPLSMRKANLERLLARRPEGIFINPFERGEIGPDLFRAACRMGLEGLVSKRRDRPKGWRLEALAQGQEPAASSDGPGDGGVAMSEPLNFEGIEKKIREAKFFFDKMIAQEGRAFGDKEPFDFYLSAFLNAARTIDYRLRHEHESTYPAWREKWDATLKGEEHDLITFMVDDRNIEVHESGSARDVKDEKTPIRGTYTDSSGTVTASGIPATLGGPQDAFVIKPAYYFTIAKVERKATEACGKYLLLLEQMFARFKAGGDGSILVSQHAPATDEDDLAAISDDELAARIVSLRRGRDNLEKLYWSSDDPVGRAFMNQVWPNVIRQLTACHFESFRREKCNKKTAR